MNLPAVIVAIQFSTLSLKPSLSYINGAWQRSFGLHFLTATFIIRNSCALFFSPIFFFFFSRIKMEGKRWKLHIRQTERDITFVTENFLSNRDYRNCKYNLRRHNNVSFFVHNDLSNRNKIVGIPQYRNTDIFLRGEQIGTDFVSQKIIWSQSTNCGACISTYIPGWYRFPITLPQNRFDECGLSMNPR